MKPKIATLIVVFLLASTVWLAGQTSITLTGRITDPQGGAVTGAQVILYTRDSATGFRSSTDASGNYRFERLRAGEYLLEAEAPGFGRTSAQEIVLAEGKPSTLDIAL